MLAEVTNLTDAEATIGPQTQNGFDGLTLGVGETATLPMLVALGLPSEAFGVVYVEDAPVAPTPEVVVAQYGVEQEAIPYVDPTTQTWDTVANYGTTADDMIPFVQPADADQTLVAEYGKTEAMAVYIPEEDIPPATATLYLPEPALSGGGVIVADGTAYGWSEGDSVVPSVRVDHAATLNTEYPDFFLLSAPVVP